ncbi:hypothetical protein OF83DRAFT_1170433 [Amylostereum chailletii]|nr:hypothetical protein OF83DRAFT_1170433 [Amylostereum chailletii]
MSRAEYQLLPSDNLSTDELLIEETTAEELERRRLAQLAARDPRFNPPPPATWKRVALLIFIVVLFFLSFSLRASRHPKPKQAPEVVYADRYSEEHQYRPAASPIYSETLKDGRILVHGAQPTARF